MRQGVELMGLGHMVVKWCEDLNESEGMGVKVAEWTGEPVREPRRNLQKQTR